MIFVNFKTYEQGSGESALSLLKVMDEVSTLTSVKLIPAVQPIDLKEAMELNTKLDVWVQHVSSISYGAHTGSTLAEEAFRIGAKGTLLNHSENKYPSLDELKIAVEHAKEVGLKVLVFASDLAELKRVILFNPDFVSYEPPSLIGSTTTSVAQAEPDIIKAASDIANGASIPLIVGAGVHSVEDIRVSLSLGARGFAIATDIVKAQNQKEEILNLLKGYNKE